LDNILVNHGNGETRFSDIQLADLGGTVPEDSKWAKGGHTVGAPIWRSPELLLNLPWGTPTDIWSFGTMVSY
jgi:serine/threonine protein kinase